MNKRRTGQYYGMVIDKPEDPLLNLRFADDVLLVAQTKADVTKMIRDLRDEAQKYGLHINMDKTKVLTTSSDNHSKAVALDGAEIEILDATASEKYLGRRLSLGDFHATELANRMSAAWRAFAKFRPVLCSRRVSFEMKLKLLCGLG